jgi:ubiquinone/menaquinone biosynthesis C-methylase UbiE
MANTEREYLLTEQYKDTSNLNARIYLHEHFSSNTQKWHYWVFDRFAFSPDARILELGCGSGKLWVENLKRIPLGWKLTLSDFSEGMLAQARQNLGDRESSFNFALIDAQAIPFEDACFDVVIANHMLYHIPNRLQALAEIRRVLRPQGRFYCATNSKRHLQELKVLITKCNPTQSQETSNRDRFTLEEGENELRQWFKNVTTHRFENTLAVTEVESLVDYILSGWWLDLSKRTIVREIVQQELKEKKVIKITSGAGLFETTEKTNKT